MTEGVKTELSNEEALKLIAKTTFRDFTKGDWEAYSGCESPNPLYGESGPYSIVIDGATVNIIHQDDFYGGQLFTFESMY